eukprot:3802791-Pyramimonas_sp.AAC.3
MLFTKGEYADIAGGVCKRNVGPLVSSQLSDDFSTVETVFITRVIPTCVPQLKKSEIADCYFAYH